MNFNFWTHGNGFRSPTEQQLVRWETDGGNHRECEDAILFEGRLYCNYTDLLEARVEAMLRKTATLLRHRLDRAPSAIARTTI